MYADFMYQVAGFTGSRHGISSPQRENLMKFICEARPLKVHHGDCLGADAEMHMLCRIMPVPVVIHPPLDNHYRAFCQPGPSDEIREPKSYLGRDWDIVTETNYLVACPRQNKRPRSNIGSGTWTTVSYAEDAGMGTIVFYPDGRAVVDGKPLIR